MSPDGEGNRKATLSRKVFQGCRNLRRLDGFAQLKASVEGELAAISKEHYVLLSFMSGSIFCSSSDISTSSI